MFSDSVRRLLLLGGWGAGLLIVPIGSIAADEYRCELYVKKFVSPIIQGCRLIAENNPKRIYAEFSETRDGKDYRETQEYPRGSCFDMIRNIKQTGAMLQKMEAELQDKNVKPEEHLIVYVFDTERKYPVRKFGQFKKGNDVTWHKNMKEVRGKY